MTKLKSTFFHLLFRLPRLPKKQPSISVLEFLSFPCIKQTMDVNQHLTHFRIILGCPLVCNCGCNFHNQGHTFHHISSLRIFSLSPVRLCCLTSPQIRASCPLKPDSVYAGYVVALYCSAKG